MSAGDGFPRYVEESEEVNLDVSKSAFREVTSRAICPALVS